MKKKNLVVILLMAFMLKGFSQEVQRPSSPYKTDFWTDGAWITASMSVGLYGFSRILNKDGITEEELAQLNKDDVLGIDRWAAGYYSEQANKISDIPFYTSFTTPFLLLFGKETNSHAGQLSVMMVESLSTAGALYTISAGLIKRSRPLVYAEDAPLKDRLSKDSQRSFFSGHVAASAAATFFTAKVYSDFYPDSKAKPWIWTGAAVLPAMVGYFRIASGNHYLTDVVLGYVIGAASGILVPELHKKKDQKLTIAPNIGFGHKSLSINYTF